MAIDTTDTEQDFVGPPAPQAAAAGPAFAAAATQPTQKDKKDKSSDFKDFSQLNPFEQLIAMIFMFFVRTDDAGDESSDNLFSSILGFGGVDAYRDWRRDMESSGWNWREKMNFNGVDLKRAREFSEGVTGVKIELGDRQKAVMSVLDDAANRAGVSKDLMTGLWGVESGFGKNRLSPSGCLGDFQFTKSTFASVIKTHGSEIAAGLRAKGNEYLAVRIENHSQSLKSGHLSEAGKADLQTLRDEPRVATYAAAFYAKDVARDLKVDPTQEKNWGIIYAGYNIGPGNADKLDGSLAHVPNVKGALGSVAAWNPKFFKNGATGTEALQNYQNSITQNLVSFNKAVAAKTPTAVADAGKTATEPVRTASSAATTAIYGKSSISPTSTQPSFQTASIGMTPIPVIAEKPAPAPAATSTVAPV